MPLNIDGPQSARLSKAIQSAYPSINDLKLILASKMDESIYNYAGFGDEYPTILFNLISQFNARYHIDKLVQALIEDRPDNALLVNFALRHKIRFSPEGAVAELSTATEGGLERMLDPQRGFTDVKDFTRRLGAIINSVCQIKVPIRENYSYGTGFLIGPDTVLTNWHVIEQITDKTRAEVELKFDSRIREMDQSAARDSIFRLDAANWLVAHSPYAPEDKVPQDLSERLASRRSPEFLDYAVLKLDGSPGTMEVADNPRGWLSLDEASQDPNDFDVGKAAVFIFQHPYDVLSHKHLPLQLDWEKPAVRGVNANGTRVFYDVNTCPGSSGSPCFNLRLELFALHHAGGKDWPAVKGYLYNEGIPITLIRNSLASLGHVTDKQLGD